MAAVLGPSAGRGQACWCLPPAGVRPVGVFFRVPEVICGCLALTKPILPKSLFRKGEMAVLVLSACLAGAPNWPKNRRQKVLRLFRAPPKKTTPILGAAKKIQAYFLMTFFGYFMDLILAKNHQAPHLRLGALNLPLPSRVHFFFMPKSRPLRLWALNWSPQQGTFIFFHAKKSACFTSEII